MYPLGQMQSYPSALFEHSASLGQGDFNELHSSISAENKKVQPVNSCHFLVMDSYEEKSV